VVRQCEEIIATYDGKRAIYVDSVNKEEILEYIYENKRHKKKFKFLSDIILQGLRHKNYCREEINEKCKNVTAMRFFVGQENDRIYCKEVTTSNGNFIVIAAILHKGKKETELTQREITAIETVGGYNYEIE
jgi:hypothetical protein